MDRNGEIAHTAVRNDGGSTPSNLTSTTTFQMLGESEDASPKERPTIQGTAGHNTQHENGFDLVDRGGREAQWRNHSDNTLGSNKKVQCIQDGMGCIWSGSKNVGIMDPTGETEARQLLAAFPALKSLLSN